MCYDEVDSWRWCSSMVEEWEVRFEEKVLHHLSSSIVFVGAPLLTVGTEIPQKKNRRRKFTDKVFEFSDTVCCRERKIYGTVNTGRTAVRLWHMVLVLWQVALTATACRAVLMCNCWWWVVFFHKYCYSTAKRVISFHSMKSTGRIEIHLQTCVAIRLQGRLYNNE